MVSPESAVGTSKAEMGQRTERKVEHDAAVIEEFLELRSCFVALVQQ